MTIFRLTLALLLLLAPGARAETHWFTGLPLTVTGFTDFETIVSTGYESARVVFVSSATGNDTTAASNIVANGHYGIADVTFGPDGIFQAPSGVVPFATIATAYAYCRNGYPDIILLEANSDFSPGASALGGYVKDGVSQTIRHIISMYGSGARPKLYATSVTSSGTQYAIVSELHFYTNDWTTATEPIAKIEGESSHVLYEGIIGDQVFGGFNTQTASYVAVRRTRLSETKSHDGSFGGSKTTNVLLEDSIFYKPYEPAGGYGRMIYQSAESEPHMTGAVVRGSTFYLASLSREGIHMRAGGTMDNNLVVQTPVYFGALGGSDARVQTANYINNVMMEAAADGATSYAKFSNISNGIINNNIWTDTDSAYSSFAMLFTGDNAYLNVAENISVSNNIINGWDSGVESGGLKFSVVSDIFKNITISGNDFQMLPNTYRLVQELNLDYSEITAASNRYYSSNTSQLFNPGPYFADWVTATGETGTFAQATYTDSSRTVKTYNQTLEGTASTEEFMTNAIASYLTREAWDADYHSPTVNSYIRAGFDKSPVPYGYETVSYPVDLSCTESLSYCTSDETCASQGGGWEYTGHFTNSYEGVTYAYFCYPTGLSPDPNCSDLTQNGDEEGIDCGGSCPPCETPVPQGLRKGAFRMSGMANPVNFVETVE
jgi:hypothetical protein